MGRVHTLGMLNQGSSPLCDVIAQDPFFSLRASGSLSAWRLWHMLQGLKAGAGV